MEFKNWENLMSRPYHTMSDSDIVKMYKDSKDWQNCATASLEVPREDNMPKDAELKYHAFAFSGLVYHMYLCCFYSSGAKREWVDVFRYEEVRKLAIVCLVEIRDRYIDIKDRELFLSEIKTTDKSESSAKNSSRLPQKENINNPKRIKT